MTPGWSDWILLVKGHSDLTKPCIALWTRYLKSTNVHFYCLQMNWLDLGGHKTCFLDSSTLYLKSFGKFLKADSISVIWGKGHNDFISMGK